MNRFSSGLKLFTVCSLCLILCGCGRKRDRIYQTRIDHDHVCTVNCQEHYYVEDRVVIRPGHLHAAHCGHRWDGSRWRVVGRDHVLPPPSQFKGTSSAGQSPDSGESFHPSPATLRTQRLRQNPPPRRFESGWSRSG